MQNSAVATDTSDPVAVTDHLFFGAQSGLEQGKTIKIVDEALSSCDDGELYLEYALSEALVWDDGQLKEASFDTERGFGLRGVLEDRFSYGHSSDMKEHSLKEAAELAQTMKQAQSGNMVAMAMQEKPPAPKKNSTAPMTLWQVWPLPIRSNCCKILTAISAAKITVSVRSPSV